MISSNFWADWKDFLEFGKYSPLFSCSAEIVVVIKVVDSSIPLFEQQLYTTSVKENVQLNTPLLDVKATSPGVDSITGRERERVMDTEKNNILF